jgi:hypothetical protein
MSVEVANNRFISLSLKRFGELYQHILSGILSFEKIGQLFIAEAELAQGFRHTDRLKTLGTVLSHLPITEYQYIGQYFLAWCDYREGTNTERTFWNVIENSKTYRGKSLIALATLEVGQGDFSSALKHCAEAMKYADNVSTLLQAVRSSAVVKGLEGSHQHALKELEAIYPLTRYVIPKIHYQYLNSYAVELGQAGRIEEARNISNIVLASPYAFAYPEWRETGQDLALRGYKSRSSIRVKQIPGNLLYLPERETTPDVPRTPAKSGRARIYNIQKWKKKMGKEPNGEEENVDQMDFNELIVKLLQLTAYEGVNEKKVRKIVKLAIEVMKEKD